MRTDTSVLNTYVMPETDALFRDLINAWGYNALRLSDAEKREIGANLARFMGLEKPYDRSYISNILAGRTGSKAVRSAIMNLLAVADGARVEQVKTHAVNVLTECNVHTGSLVLVDSRLCVCGMHFVPKSWNQKFHAKECRRLVK
jgi:hypothetical protein